MQFKSVVPILGACFLTQSVFAAPNPYPELLPKDNEFKTTQLRQESGIKKAVFKAVDNSDAIDVIRITINWNVLAQQYELAKAVIESSGTPALVARSTQKPKWGSYLGVLIDNKTGKELYYDSFATGTFYRELVPSFTFRFPNTTNNVTFVMYAENSETGKVEKVFSQILLDGAAGLPKETTSISNLEMIQLTKSQNKNALRVNFYAEGYTLEEKAAFFQKAAEGLQTLQDFNFPEIENMEFYAIFAPSNKQLHAPQNLGSNVPDYDTFLGLYYPYWVEPTGYGRWYHLVYQTNEEHFRHAAAVKAYDVIFAIENDDHHWGASTYNLFSSAPANIPYFKAIFIHEFGHFFGLQDEYDAGGSELSFAKGMQESWTPNVSFQVTNWEGLKWHDFVAQSTPLPTPKSHWSEQQREYGAYLGAYGGNQEAYKPSIGCMMDNGKDFCNVCKKAIIDAMRFFLGNE